MWCFNHVLVFLHFVAKTRLKSSSLKNRALILWPYRPSGRGFRVKFGCSSHCVWWMKKLISLSDGCSSNLTTTGYLTDKYNKIQILYGGTDRNFWFLLFSLHGGLLNVTLLLTGHVHYTPNPYKYKRNTHMNVAPVYVCQRSITPDLHQSLFKQLLSQFLF